MERVRVAGVIKMNGGFAFMHRTNVIKRIDIQNYYAFVGGGLEENETLEECCIREVKEELGINVKVIKKLYELTSEKFSQKEYFFLCEYVDGTFGTGNGPEFHNSPEYIDSGNFIPEIIKPENIKDILLLPSEIKDLLISDIKNGIL